MLYICCLFCILLCSCSGHSNKRFTYLFTYTLHHAKLQKLVTKCAIFMNSLDSTRWGKTPGVNTITIILCRALQRITHIQVRKGQPHFNMRGDCKPHVLNANTTKNKYKYVLVSKHPWWARQRFFFHKYHTSLSSLMFMMAEIISNISI